MKRLLSKLSKVINLVVVKIQSLLNKIRLKALGLLFKKKRESKVDLDLNDFIVLSTVRS